jgi:hypothetical protein
MKISSQLLYTILPTPRYLRVSLHDSFFKIPQIDIAKAPALLLPTGFIQNMSLLAEGHKIILAAQAIL